MTDPQTLETLREHEERQQREAEPPRPLTREVPDPDPFPVDALGDVLTPAAYGIHDRVQAPMATCAQTLAALATLAAQAHADVELPTGQVKPISGFFVTVAATGERKSACDSEGLWPVRKREAFLQEQYDGAVDDWNNNHDAWKQQRQQILGDKKNFPDQNSKRNALKELGSAPEEPLLPLLTCPEPTVEGLARMFPKSLPSIGVFSAEGGQFVGGHGMSNENRLRTAAALSGLWDGEPIKRVRAGDGVSILPGRRVSMHLMMQPDVAATMLSDAQLADQGLLSRMLVTAPSPASGNRLWRDARTESDVAIKRYGARLLSLLEATLPLAENTRNQLAPRALPLSPAAREVWISFADHVERQIGQGGDLEPIRGLANKLAEHAARIAAVLAIVDDIHTGEMTTDNIKAGIELAQHYAAEGLRLFEVSNINGELLAAKHLLAWLQQSWPEQLISLPDIYQRGPNQITDRRTANKLVGILEEHGWLTHLSDGGVVKGQKRRDVWQIMKG